MSYCATLTLESPLGQFVTTRPANARRLEKLGLDYCCGGKRSLRQACAEAHLDAEEILRELTTAEPEPQAATRSWAALPLSALADEIVQQHHGYLRSELPRLAELLARVVARHGTAHSELSRLQEVFIHFAADLNAHMFKEEMVLFPAVRQLEKGGPVVIPCGGGLEGPVHCMEAEHETAGNALREMRRLTNDYQVPPEVCASFQALYSGLEQLERDMHLHVHKENNILFPRATALEQARCAAVAR